MKRQNTGISPLSSFTADSLEVRNEKFTGENAARPLRITLAFWSLCGSILILEFFFYFCKKKKNAIEILIGIPLNLDIALRISFFKKTCDSSQEIQEFIQEA